MKDDISAAVVAGFSAALSFVSIGLEAAYQELSKRVGADPDEFQRGKMHGIDICQRLCNPNEGARQALKEAISSFTRRSA